MKYKTLGIEADEVTKLKRVKELFEEDFRKRTSWTEFVMSLAVGYCIGRSILLNENVVRLVEEETS